MQVAIHEWDEVVGSDLHGLDHVVERCNEGGEVSRADGGGGCDAEDRLGNACTEATRC